MQLNNRVLLLALLFVQWHPKVHAQDAQSCNGSPEYCSLPFDWYTFAGTHNSATYRLKPDCSAIASKCSEATSTCINTGKQCAESWNEKCGELKKKCPESPSWLSKLCNGPGDICEKASDVCKGWTTVCKAPLDLCVNSQPILCDNAPKWFSECLWENQPEHDFSTQLADGIRSLDIDTCVADGNRVTTCHGSGATRALGDELDVHLGQLRDFLAANPSEVVVIEYMDTDGDASVIARALAVAFEKFLPGKVFEHASPSDPWPTLGEMIKDDKRVVVFASNIWTSLPENERPRWLHSQPSYYRHSWPYTNKGHNPDEIADLMMNYKPSSEDEKYWQCVDFEYSPDKNT
ncbi:PLC-like phosphodiesterase, partial [Thamnocephalis sphaerospora]